MRAAPARDGTVVQYSAPLDSLLELTRAPSHADLSRYVPKLTRAYFDFDDRRRTADWLDQPAIAIEVAFRYYEAHRAEIDEWIRRNEETAEAAERVARARQAAS